jgi:hypothetical protein
MVKNKPDSYFYHRPKKSQVKGDLHVELWQVIDFQLISFAWRLGIVQRAIEIKRSLAFQSCIFSQLCAIILVNLLAKCRCIVDTNDF